MKTATRVRDLEVGMLCYRNNALLVIKKRAARHDVALTYLCADGEFKDIIRRTWANIEEHIMP